MLFHAVDLPYDHTEIQLVPMADLHIGDRRFAEDLFLRLRDWMLAEDHRYCLINGDVMNTALKHSRSDVYEELMNPRDQLKYARKLFGPLGEAKRVLSVTTGNHEERISRETSIDVSEELAASLGAPYDPEGVFLNVRVGGLNGRRDAPVSYGIYHTHGASGAQLIGGKALSMERIGTNIPLADLVITGHTHAKIGFRVRFLIPDYQNKKIRLHEQANVNNASFLDYGGYAERKGYRPGALGPPHVRMDGRQKDLTLIL